MKKFDLNDVGVVIQGPTDHYERVLENIDEDLSYVWSTWGDEPENNIKSIGKKIPILLNDKPKFNGFKNINMQCLSSEMGARSINKPWIVKTRGDLLWTNQKRLNKISF